MSNSPEVPPQKSQKLSLKAFLRWAILGACLFFLAKTLKDHWQEVAAIRISATGWGVLAIALLVTLIAHIWTGWVWSWILRELNQSVNSFWAIRIYLKTNIAKYLPGNVWHFYGRVVVTQQTGVPLGAATLSVLLEPLLMAAAALIIALAGAEATHGWLQGLSLLVVLMGVHPRILNPLLSLASRLKGKAAGTQTSQPTSLQIKRYPLLPLLGELVFLGLRGFGFLLIVHALTPVQPSQIQPLMGAFSFAWLLGLVIPGAPGGIGVFEATAIALLQNQLPTALLLSSVALYRLISTGAEAIGAGLAWLVEPRRQGEI